MTEKNIFATQGQQVIQDTFFKLFFSNLWKIYNDHILLGVKIFSSKKIIMIRFLFFLLDVVYFNSRHINIHTIVIFSLHKIIIQMPWTDGGK